MQSYSPDHWAVARNGFKVDDRRRSVASALTAQCCTAKTIIGRPRGAWGLPPRIRTLMTRIDLRNGCCPTSSYVGPPVWFLAAGALYLLFRRR